jgi:serine/threonine protein phosphatase PrpC
VRLRYAALSDVGRVRKDNQDSGYAGPHLLVIADGVGGSARGDIASSATVEMLRKLDVPTQESSPDDMLGALAGAIHRSHDRIAQLVREFPDIEGTSSTVTAAIFDGGLIGIGHVGDSRGYLLRDGALSQLTTDHTFVQSLIDEGRITEEEARVHPHRNLILRAVDGVHEPEPDVFTLEVALGDRLLLCSDGCSGSLDDTALLGLLAEGTPEEAAAELVSSALAAGSTDNVTVVVADLVEEDEAGPSSPVVVGAAAEAPKRRPLSGRAGRAADTGELPAVTDDVDPEEARYAPQPPRRHGVTRRFAILALVLVLAALVAIAGYKWTQNQYYVANAGDQVVIYQGVEADLPGIRMHQVKEDSPYVLADLPPYRARQVKDGISADSLTDARAVIRSLRTDVSCPPSPTPTPTPTPTKKATGKKKQPHATASAKPTPTATPTTTSSPSPSATHTPAVCLESP